MQRDGKFWEKKQQDIRQQIDLFHIPDQRRHGCRLAYIDKAHKASHSRRKKHHRSDKNPAPHHQKIIPPTAPQYFQEKFIQQAKQLQNQFH